MDFWPKEIVRWLEPEAFRVAEETYWAARTPSWKRPLYVLILTAIWIIGWVLAILSPDEHPVSPAVAFAGFFALSLVLTYGYPWLVRRAASTVVLYDRAIKRIGDQGMGALKSYSTFSWSTAESYHVLQLTTPKGRVQRFGLGDPALSPQIDQVLRQNGLTQIAS